MIDRDHDLSITRQAQLLDMSRGAVYYLPRPVSQADLALMRRIDELHLEHPFMGARMLREQLRREGIKAGRRHIGTLMRRMGIRRWRRSRAPANASPATRSTLTCCVSWQLREPTRCGRWTRPTSPWPGASST